MEKPKIYTLSFSRVYPLYVDKVEKKGRTKEELHEIIFWLTGYGENELQEQLKKEVDFETFFKEAPKINENISRIKGSICGIKVENIEDDLTRQIRSLDKLVDELAKGKDINKILRS
ncbi:DUF2200 domain-containing protein [Anaerosphaera multitolerans]|uniref:DUF2200 domain-containing protein n=1 Tax=Anaerosphaera multitolerans TaxID=2487351 RepID=A0A437S5L2_9FIRM|nr:DUF2200 domain-containing protein [Anaerosphaera multitolerans]RVU54196.1 DUF2200 domain-containing protein [Anaerosphaera multitolerans]